MKNRFCFPALCALAGVLTPGVTPATVMIEVPLEQMVDRADAVVRGRVVRVGTLLSTDHGGVTPQTVVMIQVTDWLKGRGPEVISVEELGGKWGERRLQVQGSPTYHTGEQVVLFLRRLPRRGHVYRTYAMAQGKFTVIPGVRPELSVVRRELRGLSLARQVDRHLQLEHPRRAEVLQLRGLLDLVAIQRAVEVP